jgi:glyoxylase-like metal-dependent hydrolase (beta-lactamase superfamily II)
MTGAPETYEVFAVRYARRDARKGDHFLDPVPDPDVPMPMDYFVWLLRNRNRVVLLDTGFKPAVGRQRGRVALRRPQEAALMIGVNPAWIEDVVLSHGHYDHIGCVDAFPKARLHLQERELAFVSVEAADQRYRRSFELDDVLQLVGRRYDGSLVLHDGEFELAPGISVHHLGGHTPGLQVVRVSTERGWVVLASDASHYYENLETNRPFATTYDADKVREGFQRLRELASSPAHIVPGHDPLVLQRYPAASPALAGEAVRLDVAPR